MQRKCIFHKNKTKISFLGGYGMQRDCIQVRPGVQVHQHKRCSQPPMSYAPPHSCRLVVTFVLEIRICPLTQTVTSSHELCK